MHSIRAHKDGISSIQIYREDISFVTASHDSWIKIWDTRKLATISSFEHKIFKYDESVLCLGISPNKNYLFSGSVDGALRVFE